MRNNHQGQSSRPVIDKPLQIVRPSFPPLSMFAQPFDEALKSGQVTNGTRWVVEFEKRLTDYLGVPTIAFCNGQLALMAMLRASGISDGEVIVPSFTFSATPHAVRWVGALPVFADIIDDGTMRLDPRDVERRITKRTVAILSVDPYGIASDYAALSELGRRHRIKVLIDSAPSFGTRVGGRLVGGFCDAQIFSFHATKAFATMEGGCLCSNDPALLERAKAIRNFGQVAGGDCDEPGFNGKMTEVAALIGLAQLDSFEQAIVTRRGAVDRMRSHLASIPGLTVGREPAGEQAVWLYLPVLVEKSRFGLDRDELADQLAELKLFVRKYYSPPCHLMTAYAEVGDVSLPHTERAASQVIALPVYNDMTDSECNAIVEAITWVYKQYN